MELSSIIEFLRSSCSVDDPDLVLDTEFISLTDEELKAVLKIVCSQIYKHTDLENMPESKLYPVILLAKKELYHRLAVANANLYSLEGESGSLNRSDKFKHYYQLIAQVQEEYEQWVEEERTNTDVSNTDSYGNSYTQGQVFLSSRYHSLRNYSHAKNPVIGLKVDNIYRDKVEISWALKRVNRFRGYKVYINKYNNIIDIYNKNNINTDSVLVLHSTDIHKTLHRIEGLQPNTLYHLAIVVEEQNGLTGFDEVQFVTEGE